MLSSILYVSRSKLVLPGGEAAVRTLVERSRIRNAAADITGALVFTELHFAQFIEGPCAAIETLFARIMADCRHTHVDVIEREGASRRQFKDWCLAYAGPEQFIDHMLTPMLKQGSRDGRQKTAVKLRELLHAMAAVA